MQARLQESYEDGKCQGPWAAGNLPERRLFKAIDPLFLWKSLSRLDESKMDKDHHTTEMWWFACLHSNNSHAWQLRGPRRACQPGAGACQRGVLEHKDGVWGEPGGGSRSHPLLGEKAQVWWLRHGWWGLAEVACPPSSRNFFYFLVQAQR